MGQMLFFGQKYERVGKTDRVTDTSPCINALFFFSYKMLKTLPATTQLLFGLVPLFMV